jgi:hypothetical protein
VILGGGRIARSSLDPIVSYVVLASDAKNLRVTECGPWHWRLFLYRGAVNYQYNGGARRVVHLMLHMM